MGQPYLEVVNVDARLRELGGFGMVVNGSFDGS